MSEESKKQVVIHTDGACTGNPGPGGWGVVLQYGALTKELSGGEIATTNNRMELQAAISALSALRFSCNVTLYTDSEYLRNGITKWIFGWKRRGWVSSQKAPVKNVDLWKLLDAQASRHQIEWKWLRGHSGHPLNERCDALGREQVEKIRGKIPRQEIAAQLAEFKRQQSSGSRPAQPPPGGTGTLL